MPFLSEIRQHKFRTWKTFNACFMFICMGICSSATGPTLLDLQIQVNVTLEQISAVLPLRSAGSMAGAFVSGILMMFLDVQIILPVAFTFTCISAFLIPFCPTLYWLFAVLFTNGMALGMINNCSNMWVIHMWGKENGPFLQLLHFSFGLGSLFAPIVVEPFLIPLESSNRLIQQIENHNSPTLHHTLNHTATTNDTLIPAVVEALPVAELNLRYAYYIIGGISTAVLCSLIATLIYKPDNKPHPTRDLKKMLQLSENAHKNESAGTQPSSPQTIKDNHRTIYQVSNVHKLLLTFLGMAFIHLVYGVELSFGSLLPIFSVKSALKFSKSQASYLTATYWACFTFFRIITVVLVSVLSNKQMIGISLAMVAVANSILLPFANGNQSAMWAGACLMGLGISSLYPCFLGYLEDMFPVSGTITSCINIFSCIGEFIIPLVVAAYIEQNPMIYLYVVFGYGFSSVGVFLLCTLIEHKIKQNASINEKCEPKTSFCF